jgi:uncharacterized protein DUF3806
MKQKIEALSNEDAARVEKHRTWVREHFTPETQPLYADFDQKLLVIDTILKNKWVGPTDTWKLQSLGIALGDALVQRQGYEWVAVEDEQGRDPALRVPGTTLTLFPLTMISKRIEQGEEVDVYTLFEGVCTLVEKQKESGRF